MKSRKQAPAVASAATMRRKLLAWYDRNKRSLPWRCSGDPYRIWISEIMLQQTRVQAVIPYYEKFLRRFPDVRSLAAADDDALLAAWSGLGYYSRARNLKKAAQRIVNDHVGSFPSTYSEAIALPGIGEYTAAAVLSIAFGARLPVLDGNVARVLARLLAINANAKTGAGKKRLTEEARRLLAPRRPGDFNQAMMELGATVCVPENPKCDACPLRSTCRAFAEKRVAEFPPPRIKAAPKLRRFVAAIVTDENERCLLVKRPKTSQWMEGFWELPMTEVATDWNAANGAAPFKNRGWILDHEVGRVSHSITTNRLEIVVCNFTARRKPRARGTRWLHPDGITELPVTTITRKALRLLTDDSQQTRTRRFLQLV